jgi:alpha-amylase
MPNFHKTPSVVSSHRPRLASFLSLIVAAALCACTTPTALAPNTAISSNLAAIISPVTAKDPGSTLPANWHNGTFMEIFVRGYKDSDGDGIGDLRGVTQSLDYLRDLGIKGIWLMPITQSLDGDHGYAVTDYRSIETAYGSMADFDELLKQAHARGIGVIMDYVINHSASTHPLFLSAMASPTSPYRHWFLWENVAPKGWDIYGKNPWHSTKTGAYFAAFDTSMPDFNLRNRDAVAFHIENMRFWLNRGVDGFRFDAVGHLVENGPKAWDNQKENYVLMNEVRALVASYERRYMVCESPSDPAGFAAPNACGSGFAFTHHENVMKTAKGDADAMKKISDYFKTAQPNMATMLANHDQFAGDRVWDQVKGNVAQYRLAAATYLLQPGTPFIYYGEEIGMAGAANLDGDPKLRTPMSWNADAKNAGFSTAKPFRALSGNYATHNVANQQNNPDSLLTFYKAMIKLRNTLPSISQGSFEAPFISGNVMGFTRKFGAEQTLVIINYGTTGANVKVENLRANNANSAMEAKFPSNAAKLNIDATGAAQLTIAPQSVQVFSVK